MSESLVIHANVVCREDGMVRSRSIAYSQEDPSRYPISCQELEARGFKMFKYYWSHWPTGKSGTKTLWALNRAEAEMLVEHWNQYWNSAWAYTLV